MTTLCPDLAMPSIARMAMQKTDVFKTISAAFPHIASKLAFFWGEPEFVALMEGLQQNKRDDHRAGFPPAILMALESLAMAHDRAFPKLARNESDLWNLSKAR